jgi:hypothetical protein
LLLDLALGNSPQDWAQLSEADRMKARELRKWAHALTGQTKEFDPRAILNHSTGQQTAEWKARRRAWLLVQLAKRKPEMEQMAR